MFTPLVSVITPSYNRAHTLQKAIDSVLAQTYTNWELIVIDDGSTDDTKNIVSNNKDSRIKYHYKENGGPARARNLGIKHSQGKWVVYLDSDDILFPNCIKTMVDYIEEKSSSVFAIPRSDRKLELYENGKLIKSLDETDDVPENFTIDGIFQRTAGFSCTGFMHLRSLYEEGIRWDPDCPLMEDWELMLSIGNKYPEGFVFVPVVLQSYRMRFNSDNLVSSATYSDWVDAFEYIYQKHKDDDTLARQTWYPRKVEKWRTLQKDFEDGKLPPYTRFYFER